MPVSAPKTTFIYALCEPGTKTIRYFGKADNPKRRLREHRKAARDNKSLYSSRWINKLYKAGKNPDLHVLCEVPKNDFVRFERAFIALGRQYGFALTNLTDGGEGLSGWSHSPETRKKIGRSGPANAMFGKTGALNHNFGKPCPEWQKEILRQCRTGTKSAPETCLKISQANKGKPKPEGFGEKIRAAQKGREITWRSKLFGKRTWRPTASKYLGVTFITKTAKWRASITNHRKKKHLGVFLTEEAAARAFDAAALQIRGEDTKLNFPNGQ